MFNPLSHSILSLKGTISQYFSTMACPVCQDLTPTDLCAKCRGMSQKSAVILTTRMHRWERTYQHLAEVSCQDCCHVACSLCQSEITQFSNFLFISQICHGCSGSRDTKLRCVSLDCPVFYKLVQCTRDLRSSEHFRKILDVCNNKKTPTTTGMSPQGRKLDRR